MVVMNFEKYIDNRDPMYSIDINSNWHKINLPDQINRLIDMHRVSWIEKNIVGHWSYSRNEPSDRLLYFSDDNDAVLFKLTWL